MGTGKYQETLGKYLSRKVVNVGLQPAKKTQEKSPEKKPIPWGYNA